MAMIAALKGYKTLMVQPARISQEKKDEIEVLGAENVVCPNVPFTDPRHFFHTAARLAKERSNCFFTNQFDNEANFKAHFEGTGPEIWEQTGKKIDAFVHSSGTGGTIAGVSTYLKQQNPGVKIYHLDPCSAATFEYIKTGVRIPSEVEGYKIDLLPDVGSSPTIAEGIGTARITGQFAKAQIDGAFKVSDKEAVEMAYYLKEYEGLYVGPAAALNVVGAVKAAERLGPGHTIVCVVCDGGARYRSTLFNQEELSKLGLTPSQFKKGRGNLEFVDKLNTQNYYEKH